MIYIRTLGSKGTQNSNICTLVDRFYFNAYFTAQNSESNPSQRVVVNYLVSTVATCQSGQGSGIVPIHWPVQTKMSCLVTTCLVQSAATASLVNITKTLMYTNASWMYNQTCSCRSRCEVEGRGSDLKNTAPQWRTAFKVTFANLGGSTGWRVPPLVGPNSLILTYISSEKSLCQTLTLSPNELVPPHTGNPGSATE